MSPSHDGPSEHPVVSGRIALLRKRLAELQAGKRARTELHERIVREILAEKAEVRRHNALLPSPWSGGYLIEREFLRHSFHKSETSRSKELRQEELNFQEAMARFAEQEHEVEKELEQLAGAGE